MLSKLILSILIACVLASSNDKKKLIQKIKHAKPNYKHVCSDFEKDFHPAEEKRLFIPVNTKATLASLESLSSVYDIFSQQCSEQNSSQINNEILELKWKYQFFESPHCIRVELDLGNVTKLKSFLNLDYYMFSYREFGKKNTHLKRQLIDDQVNSLTIHRVHIRPYVVCVTFYKQNPKIFDEQKASNSSQNETNCSEFTDAFRQDDRMHDVDLCVDIDTQAHF